MAALRATPDAKVPSMPPAALQALPKAHLARFEAESKEVNSHICGRSGLKRCDKVGVELWFRLSRSTQPQNPKMGELRAGQERGEAQVVKWAVD